MTLDAPHPDNRNPKLKIINNLHTIKPYTPKKKQKQVLHHTYPMKVLGSTRRIICELCGISV